MHVWTKGLNISHQSHRKMSKTIMFLTFFTLLLPLATSSFAASNAQTQNQGFTYNGFKAANLSLDGIAGITKNGLLEVTNSTMAATGHAFYPDPISLKNSPSGESLSFSTSFVFAIRTQPHTSSTGGLAFVIAPTKSLPRSNAMLFLGLFNTSTNGSASNHIFAVEFDTVTNERTNDIIGHHVGVDINTIDSIMQEPAGYYAGDLFHNLTLSNGKPIRVWVEYDGTRKLTHVTLAPVETDKPSMPLLNLPYDLSPVFQETMYVGFSASSGRVETNHYILGWSFGAAQQLDLSKLPNLPRIGPKKVSQLLITGPIIAFLLLVSSAIFSVAYYTRRRRKFAEVLEDWEVEYGPHRFKYKDLYTATKGFKDTELLGAGGFGKVYKGLLRSSRIQIAVKRISHESRQGIREFVAEIVSLGRMSHRNIVPLLGYCRRKGELLLVYEYMPNGSLDRFLYGQEKLPLSWDQRFKIIKGVASGLLYLHEGWEQVVIHRDIKASNVLVDDDLNGRLGDFGLAKLYDHGSDPETTNVVGTVGYLAPEHYRTGRATTNTDVYAFGAFLLEVVCGRRPVQLRGSVPEDLVLAEWVFRCWSGGRVVEAVDPNLHGDFVEDEVELVLKVGLLCSNSDPTGRPSMRKVVLYLDGSMPLPESIAPVYAKSFEDVSTSTSHESSSVNASSQMFSFSEMSLLSGGR